MTRRDEIYNELFAAAATVERAQDLIDKLMSELDFIERIEDGAKSFKTRRTELETELKFTLGSIERWTKRADNLRAKLEKLALEEAQAQKFAPDTIQELGRALEQHR